MTTTRTYAYTGANASWTVPANIDGTTVHVKLRGATGGTMDDTASAGGGYVEGDLTVSPGDILTLWPGGRGTYSPSGGISTGSSWNGGGPGLTGGGGATDIRLNGSSLAQRVAISGGGGGRIGTFGPSHSGGGVGGANTGGSGDLGSSTAAATGGTQAAGGAAGTAAGGGGITNATAGSSAQGGTGRLSAAGVYTGPGGGGGYFGGGGGSLGGGAGGSNYVGGLTGVVTNNAGTADVAAADGSIDITYNLIPNAPHLLSPVGSHNLDRNLAQTFSWMFSDDDASDSQSAYELRYRGPGGGAWTTTGKIASATSSRTFAVDTFLALVGTLVEWQVRTWDSSDAVGNWSTSGYFVPQNPPATSLAFTAAPTITVNNPVVSAHRTDDATVAQYQLRVVTDDGAGNPTTTVVADTGVVVRGATGVFTKTLPAFAYVSGQTYHVQGRVAAPTDIWQHAWTDSGPIVANVAAPRIPTLVVTPVPSVGLVQVAITNPGGDPSPPVYNEVWRTDPSLPGANPDELIATNVPVNSTYSDWQAPLNRPVGYRAVAVSAAAGRTSSA